MADTHPYSRDFQVPLASSGATTSTERVVCVAPFAGTVSAVDYVADAALTGADTNSRTLSLVNKGQAGAGSTVAASKAFTSGVNAPADRVTAITLSGTAANLNVAAGDVLVIQSNAVGASGLADPGGLVRVTLSRS